MNTDPNCGCNQTKSGSDAREYLMVKTTASEASTCGAPGVDAGVAACPKQEPTYDVSMSDFVMPIDGGSTSMEVCNASVYSLSTWLHFFSPAASLQITNITGNILTLSNKCPNGETIDSNPLNVVIAKGTSFVVGPEPQCNTDAEDQERINSAFALATELCIPNMATVSSTTTIRPIGKIESDTANSSIRKCIKAIFGIVFKGGAPYLTNLRQVTNPVDANYRRLAKHKTTDEVVEINNYSETSGLTTRSYGLMINEGTERVVPTYFVDYKRDVLAAGNSSDDPFDWPNFPGSDVDLSFDLTDKFADLFNERDHYYVRVKVDLGMGTQSAGSKSLKLTLNGLYAGKAMISGTSDHGGCTVNTVTTLVKIPKTGSDQKKLLVKLTNVGTFNYYYRIVIDEILY